MSRVEGFVVQEAALELESWSDGADAPVRWRTLLSADRTPSAALTVGVAEVAPGGSGRLHRHAQPEAYYVLSGRGVVTIDGREHAVHPGSAVFVPGGAEHAARNAGADVLRILYAFPTDSFADVEYEFS